MSDDSLGLMSSDQLRTYQCEIAEEIAAIKKQLEAADYDRKVNGKWADKSWYGKARWALRLRQRLSAAIEDLNILGEIIRTMEGNSGN